MASSTLVHGPADGHTHTHTIIFLHGRDSSADEFASEFFESEASGSEAGDGDRTIPALTQSVRWVFPRAPILPSKRFDTPLSQWFDMWSVENPDEQMEDQRDDLRSSIQAVLKVVRAEEQIVPRARIFLGGISQGFATALSTMLAEGQGGFAGLIGLASWLPLAETVEAEMARSNYGNEGQLRLFAALQSLYGGQNEAQKAAPARIMATPIFLAHATDDDVVPVQNGKRMQRILRSLGLTVSGHQYADGGHWVNEPQGVDDILNFLKQHM